MRYRMSEFRKSLNVSEVWCYDMHYHDYLLDGRGALHCGADRLEWIDALGDFVPLTHWLIDTFAPRFRA